MATSPDPTWDTSVLAHPLVLDIPDQLPDHPGDLLATAVAAIERQLAGDPAADALLAHLAHAGVVALRTSSGSFTVRETHTGWILARHLGDPDPADLAAAAHLRAHRLARARAGQAEPGQPPGP